ncbi:MAG TPA: hypothetical protein VNF47_21355 [Streptosporangiaceae bacterium]|nr:hypothetical protein [Streptosporangiaceae bacterium]
MVTLWTWLAGVNSAWREKRDAAPLPLLRWSGAVGVFVAQWIAGAPAEPSGWICPGVIAGLLILPDAGSITVGALKVQMRQARTDLGNAQADVEQLRTQVQQMQVQQAATAAATANGNIMHTNVFTEPLRGATAAATAVRTGEGSGSVPLEQVYNSLAPAVAQHAPADVRSGS